MSYRRVKDIEYDGDEFEEDFDDEPAAEEEEMTTEDREQLQKSGIEVRNQLGPLSDQVTEKEVQDALWHYYFDVDKSVTYLKGIHEPKKAKISTPQKAKAESKFDLAVKSAAASATASPSPKKNGNQKSGVTSLSNSIASLSVTPEKIKSKNLNVEEEFKKANLKKSAAFVVVGHVDHGKSTLMGRLLYDLKFVNEQTMRKYQKESDQIGKGSFALAWVMDATSDERARGITVDTATKFFETDTTRFTILDAPGHQDFIPNMIAGASQADFAVLVIDAGVNSFESGLRGQTKEHALLVRSMGVQRLIVAVNKMDRVEWSEERFTEIQTQATTFLTSANFSPSQVTFVPCAGLSGENILTPAASPNAAWYTGPTLVQALDSIETAASNARSKPLLLVISDVFPTTASSNSTSIAGRLEAGSIQAGDTILLQPAGETATVKSIEVDDNPVDWAIAGQIITLNLVDVDSAHIRRGDVASDPKHPLRTTNRFTVKILTFEHVLPMFVDVLRGRMQVPGKVADLVATLDKATGRPIGKRKPRVLQPGVAARVVIEVEREVPIADGWRVVLRAEGRSVAAGLVETEDKTL